MSKKITRFCQHLNLTENNTNVLTDSAFALKVPKDFMAQIQPGDMNDPLLKQVLPVPAENAITDGFLLDPVGDLQKNPTPGLIHKYHGRALLIASPKCDIHCRYCFRRHFPYEDHSNQRHWAIALETIANDNSIHEVILSGGDPMSLHEDALMRLILAIEKIEHVSTLRIHSRSPIVSPSTAPQAKILNWAKHSRLNKVLVVHCNHANELSDKTSDLLTLYKNSGFHLLNQSVLLKDINDSADVLVQLSHKLFQQGVLPYYLHQLDKVEGAAHFEVSDSKAQTLLSSIRAQLPGYLVPKLVREIAGQANKTPL